MTHIKRGAALLLCLCMALSLCACGGKGGENTEADTPPREEGKKTAPPSGGPLPLSQYIQSSEPQILYKTDKLDKDTHPDVYLIQDGTVISPKQKFTFGELSKMSDGEIIQAIMTAEESPTCEPCAVYLESDSTGNAVEKEILIICNPVTQFCRSTEFETLLPDSGVIYDSTYTGYWNQDNERYYFVRGEQEPFVLDGIGAEGVVVDPSQEESWELFCSFAWLELIDGTRAPLRDVHAKGDITSCALTENGQKTLSLDDVKFTASGKVRNPVPSDFSPSVLQTPEGRAALLASDEWLHSSLYGYESPLPPIPAHRYISFYHDIFGNIRFYNATDTEQEVQNLTLGKILIYMDLVEGRTGEFEYDYDFLIREYGPPSGAVMLWEERSYNGFKHPAARITYYWAGDGFYIGAEDVNNTQSPSSLRYTKSGLSEQDLKALVEYEDGTYDEDTLRIYTEINRLLAN